MRDVLTTTSPRYAGGSHSAAGVSSPGQAAVLAMDGFETPAAALAEDRLRLAQARWLLPVEPPLGWTQLGGVLNLNKHRLRYHSRPLGVPALQAAELVALIRKLEANVEAGAPVSSTLASSIAMRDTRISVIGAQLDAFADFDDHELKVVTVVKPSWAMTPSELLRTDAHSLKLQFYEDLKRSGVFTSPDPFVAFLHGEFEPTNGLIIPHFHSATTPAKAALLKQQLGALDCYAASDIVRRPIRSPNVGDRTRQLSYMLKAFWPQRALRMTANGWKRDHQRHRVCEPWSTVYLLWLDRHRLLDLTVAHGTWSRKNGGSEAWKAFSLIVEGVGREKASVGSTTARNG